MRGCHPAARIKTVFTPHYPRFFKLRMRGKLVNAQRGMPSLTRGKRNCLGEDVWVIKRQMWLGGMRGPAGPSQKCS